MLIKLVTGDRVIIRPHGKAIRVEIRDPAFPEGDSHFWVNVGEARKLIHGLEEAIEIVEGKHPG